MSLALPLKPDILEAINRPSARRLSSLVTKPCMPYTLSIGSYDLGYKVVVVADATGSPGSAHQIGLSGFERGELLSARRACNYEWVRTVEKRWHLKTLEFQRLMGLFYKRRGLAYESEHSVTTGVSDGVDMYPYEFENQKW